MKHTLQTALIGISLLACTPAFATPRNDALEPAASACEDMVEIASDQGLAATKAKLGELRASLGSVKKVMDPAAFAKVSDKVATLESLVGGTSTTEFSLTAMDAYKVIANSMDWPHNGSPQPVGMLDYTGFRLNVLANAPTAQWSEISKTADEAHAAWKSLDAKLKDNSGLQDMARTIDKGMSTAIANQDTEMLKFVALTSLDTVDLLEQFFKKK